jgi:hypothetical protein
VFSCNAYTIDNSRMPDSLDDLWLRSYAYFILPLKRAPVPVRRSTLVCIVLADVCVGTMFERYILVVEVPVP